MNDKRKYKINDTFLEKDTDKKYYYLGLMASDGFINKQNNQIGIAQSGEEGKRLVNYIKTDLLKAENPIYVQKTSHKDSHRLLVISKALKEKLADYNIVPNKTKTFTIPDSILSNKRYLRYFLIGYLDGDGFTGVYGTKNKMLKIGITINTKVFTQLQTLDIFKKALVNTSSSSNVVKTLVFNGKKAIEFAEWLYQDITVFKSFKYLKYEYYKNNDLLNNPRTKFIILKPQIVEYLKKHPTTNCTTYAKELGIAFQTVYKIRKEIENTTLP